MWFWNLKKQFGGFSCVRLLIFISMFQCWTAAPSSLPFKSFYWSISSCVDSSLATRPLHYKRYIVSVCHGHFLNFVVFNRWQLIVNSEVQQPWELHFCSMSQNLFSCLWMWTLTLCSAHSDLTGVSALPTVPQAVHQPCRSASHTLSEYFQPKWCVCMSDPECYCKPRQRTQSFITQSQI